MSGPTTCATTTCVGRLAKFDAIENRPSSNGLMKRARVS